VYLLIIATLPVKKQDDSYLWYSVKRIFKPDGGNLPELRQTPQEPKRQHVSATQQKEPEIRQQ